MTAPGSVIVRRSLGRQLRHLRESAGKSVADVVTAGIASRAKIHKIEGGKGPVKMVDVWALCRLFDAPTDETDRLAALAAATQQEDYWEAWGSHVVPERLGLYLGLEQSASQITAFDPEFVVGVLQTEGYARAVIESARSLAPDVVDQRVRFRMDRARRVLGNRPKVTVILSEGAMRLSVGSPEVMAAQLDHLQRLNRDGVATVRVLPSSSGAYPVRGSFTLLDFDDSDEDPSVAYLEFSMGARYVEQPEQVREYRQTFGQLMERTVTIGEWSN